MAEGAGLHTEMEGDVVLLGLIGDHIDESQAPYLHRAAGRLLGKTVRYDLLVPGRMGMSFEAAFAYCEARGYRALNITYPYKERVTALVDGTGSEVIKIGSANTVKFEGRPPRAFNTDFTGFVAAFRQMLVDQSPGRVCMIGCGGVGKAVAHGLVALGARELVLVDCDPVRAQTLADTLRAIYDDIAVEVTVDAVLAARGASGLVNCTPLGMYDNPGSPLDGAAMSGATWAFDAVYTPVDTDFLRMAAANGLRCLSGYELHFYQGLHAAEIIHGETIDLQSLRDALTETRD
ncbi:MAG: shikimate dehydrogenase family protein [Hyphomicrobiaceae bacterium]